MGSMWDLIFLVRWVQGPSAAQFLRTFTGSKSEGFFQKVCNPPQLLIQVIAEENEGLLSTSSLQNSVWMANAVQIHVRS